MTKPLTKQEYPSPFNFNREEIILSLAKKDELFVETVVDIQGRIGKPIYQESEIIY